MLSIDKFHYLEYNVRIVRILVISNLYLPYHIGGYELVCADVVDALRERGHELRVLTSSRGQGMSDAPLHVLRILEARLRPSG